MTDTIKTLLEAATRAPSGENAQPWRFVVKKNGSVDVYLDSERDSSPYSWGSRSSYVAIGAALENMKIKASGLGYVLQIDLFPEVTSETLVARVNLNQTSAFVDPLDEVIEKRVTNRKAYGAKPVSPENLKEIKNSLTTDYGLMVFTDNPDDRERLATTGSTNEQIMLANPQVHSYFFSHVNWTEAEDKEKLIGFYIKTLELPPPAVMGFKLVSSWLWAQRLNKYLKFNKVVQEQNKKIYKTGGGIGAILVNEESPRGAVKAGMSLQRVWLTATKLGLSLQPLAGLLYMYLGVKNHSSIFTNEESALIYTQYESINDIFNIKDGACYFMFRLGYASHPSAQARRFDVEKVSTFE